MIVAQGHTLIRIQLTKSSGRSLVIRHRLKSRNRCSMKSHLELRTESKTSIYKNFLPDHCGKYDVKMDPCGKYYVKIDPCGNDTASMTYQSRRSTLAYLEFCSELRIVLHRSLCVQHYEPVSPFLYA